MRRLLISSLSTVALCASASAATLRIPGDYASLGDALVFAGPGDTIEFADGEDFSSENVQVLVGQSVTITGTSVPANVMFPPIRVLAGASVTIANGTISCNSFFSSVLVQGNGTLTLDGVESEACPTMFRSLVAGNDLATVNVIDSTFAGYGSSGSGAAVLVRDFGELTVQNSIFSNNSGLDVLNGTCDSPPCAGAISAGFGAFVVITDSEFSDNSGLSGGAITADTPLYFEVRNTVFSNNSADQGAAIWVSDATDVVLADITVDGHTNTNGASIYISGLPGGTVDVQRLRATDNLVSNVSLPAVLEARGVTDMQVHSAWMCGSVGGDIGAYNGSTLDLQGAVLSRSSGAASLDFLDSSGTLTNVTFAGQIGDAIYGEGATTRVTATNTIFYGVAGSTATSMGLVASDITGTGFNNGFQSQDGTNSHNMVETALEFDPMLVSPQPDCDANLWLTPNSPVRNAGEPTVSNLDGSISDIGGFGGPWAWIVDADGDGSYADLDCDETSATVYPGAPEVPNDNIDQDCDGFDLVDVDLDGFPSLASGGTDCNDNDPNTYPGAAEVPYDLVDQDCDGFDLIDQDDDGFDGIAPPLVNGTDCNDLDPTIRPGVPEIWYDGVDQNCDGADDFDQDGDGDASDQYGGTDCDDTDATVNPAATEIWYDGIDQNCSGGSDYDQDGDGESAEGFGGDDCDDTDAGRSSNLPETPYDGVDQDCTGQDLIDADGDGSAAVVVGGDDCNDGDATVFPGAIEDSSRVDRDCDGYTDPVGVVRPRGCSTVGKNGAAWFAMCIPFLLIRRSKRLEVS